MRIDEPSVINGAQTLHALKDAKRLDALVLVRVIVIPSESKVNKNLINSIIFRTNQQNQMFTFDLRANDKIQVKLAKEFSEKGVFYERRRKEWELNKRHYHNQKFDYLSSKKLAQILMTCKYKFGNISGVAIARKDIQYLFEDEVYFNLFNVPFREIYFKYALYKFIIATFKKIRRSLKRRQKNSTLWTCLAITWNSINKSGHLNNWCKKLEEKPTKLDPYLDDCKKLKIIIKNIFDIYWGVWEKEHRKNRDLSLHDFFKSTSVNLKIVKQLSEKFYKKFEKSLDEALQ